MATTTRRAAKAAAPVEPDETEFDDMEEADEVEDGDDELEELEEDEEPAPAPKTKRAKAAPAADGEKPKRQPPVRPTIEFGSPWLAAYVTENTDETYDARGIRMLLRKLAKDGALNREVGVTRERYEFTGEDDPTVVRVLEMVKSGAAKALKQEGLQAVKDKAEAKRAAKKAAKAAATPVEDDEMEDADDEVEEAPAPKARRAAPKTAAPAKATPATARRRTATKA